MSEPARQGDPLMSTTRTLTAVALAASAALTTTALAVAPAHAGGAPVLGTVTVDRRADLAGDSVTLSGTYTCSGGTAVTRASIYTEVATRATVGSAGATSVVCDGATHRWSTTGPRENLARGSATALVTLEVCNTSGDCPWNLFDSRVTLRGA